MSQLSGSLAYICKYDTIFHSSTAYSFKQALSGMQQIPTNSDKYVAMILKAKFSDQHSQGYTNMVLDSYQ